jgi:hypothetical protein
VGRLLVFEEALVARSNRTAGIEIRHKKSCPVHAGRFCVCDPSYRAQVWSPSDGRFVRRTSRNLTQAIVWSLAGHRFEPSSARGRRAPCV